MSDSPRHSGFLGQFLAALLIATLALAVEAAKTPSDSRTIHSIDLRNITVADAMRMLSEQTRMNFVASEQASNKRLSLFVHDMSPMEILDTIAHTYNLWYQQDPKTGVVRIYTPAEFRQGEVGGNLEGLVDIFTLRYPNAIDVAYAIKNLWTTRVILDVGNLQMNDATQELRQRFNRFDVMNSRRASMGGGQGSAVGGVNSSTPTNQSQTNSSEVSKPDDTVQLDPQMEMKSLLSGNKDEGTGALSERMQKKALIYVAVVRPQNRIIVKTQDPEAMDQIRRLVERMDLSIATLVMEVKIYKVDLQDNMKSAVNLYEIGGQFMGSMIPAVPAVGAASTFAGAAMPGLKATYIGKNFQAAMDLLEKEGRLTELAAPVLVTSNQEVSRVFVGTQVPIVTGYTTSNNNAGGGGGGNQTTISTAAIQPVLVPVTEVRNVGTTLTLTPSVNADRTVNVSLLIEQSVRGAPAPIPLAVGSAVETVNVDTVTESTYTGTIVSRDKLPVMVGGLINESSEETVNGVPLFMDIPWLGNLFKETVRTKKRSEIIMVIRPFIQNTPTEAAEENDKVITSRSLHPQYKDFNEDMNLYQRPRERPNDYDLTPEHRLFPYQDRLKTP